MKTSSTTDKSSFLYRLAMTACFLTGCFFTVRALQPDALSTVPASVASVNAETGTAQPSKPVTQPSASDTLPYTTANIEDLKPGDLVLSRDEHGKTIGWKPIKEVYRRTSYHLRHLNFESADGTQQTLSTTDEHPFWSVTADDFVDAGDLSVGHKVTGPDGQQQILVSTEREEFPDGIPVFNFQVKDYHTYYVAADKDSDVLLVHNADCGDFLPTHSLSVENGDFDVVQEMAEKMKVSGWDEFEPIIAHTDKDGLRYIVDGHHRVEAAKQAGVDVVWREATPIDLSTFWNW